MLRFAHSYSSSSSSSSSPGNGMDMSVLERQRAMLQRLYQQQNQENNHVNMHSVVDHQELLSHCWQPARPHDQFLYATGHPAFVYPEMASTSVETSHQSSYLAISNSNNNSSMTRVLMSKPDGRCNSGMLKREGNVSCSIKKRKAEFDVEEEGKDKGLEAEEAGEEQSEITTKTDRETSTNTCSKESSKVSEGQKPDYIHVRARRGQATDSHSLAERARREKISKKMKCLQDLVPGCSKVTGKAGMLDEIINYVQSLQKQVEFLSMKLAASNPRLDFSIDNYFAKEIPAYVASLSAAATQLQATNSTCFQYNKMQQGTSNCTADIAIDQSQVIPQKAGMPVSEGLLDSTSIPQLQQLSGWDSDWPSLFNVSFH
ncbi:hypothetical protein Pfo_019137 [Paulownia fortunei]|nr:hypothetical protein Pfo_019137 [Paulownia fortunei]